jgi:hypothetical protein
MIGVRSRILDVEPHRKAPSVGDNLSHSVQLLSYKSEIVIAQARVQKKRWEHNARRIALVTVLYVISVLSFSYFVYPHIPEQKAGGNYKTATRVSPRLVIATPAGECPNDLMPIPATIIKPAIKADYLIIEEDSNWVYFANDSDKGGPRAWSWPRFGEKSVRPKVYAVNRSCIASIDSIEDDSSL